MSVAGWRCGNVKQGLTSCIHVKVLVKRHPLVLALWHVTQCICLDFVSMTLGWFKDPVTKSQVERTQHLHNTASVHGVTLIIKAVIIHTSSKDHNYINTYSTVCGLNKDNPHIYTEYCKLSRVYKSFIEAAWPAAHCALQTQSCALWP